MSSYFVEKEKVLKIISGICQFDENQDLYKTFWNSSYDVDKNETGELNLQSAIASNFKDDVTNIINSTGHYEHTNDLNSTTLITILNSYHEQPNIIRACVKELVSPLMDRFDMLIRLVLALSHTETKGLDSVMMASVQEKNMTLIHRYIQHIHVLSKILYVICKVISYKHVLSILPHEVSHLERCYSFFMYLKTNEPVSVEVSNWETRYVLIVWLSMLSLIPFDLHSMDSTNVLITPTVLLDGSMSNVFTPRETFTTAVSTNAQSYASTSVVSSMVMGIIDLEKSYLTHTGVIREVAGMALSCLLTRPDSHKNGLLDAYIQYCHEQLEAAVGNADTIINGHSSESMRFVGILYSIAQIYKRGNRQQLLSYADLMLKDLLSLTSIEDFNDASNTTNTLFIKSMSTRKLITKCVQRIGISLLIPKVANWRYCLGKRTLAVNETEELDIHANTITNTNANLDISKNTNLNNLSNDVNPVITLPTEVSSVDNTVSHAVDESDSVACKYHVEIARIIDFLCLALCDEDTIVRWSAAKGLGRITMRLPLLMGNDVILSIIHDNFHLNCTHTRSNGMEASGNTDKKTHENQGKMVVLSATDENAWHGGCLVLAEFARRGLLCPMSLRDTLKTSGLDAAWEQDASVLDAESHLDLIVPYITYAMQFDIRRGQHSVGTHVRDAACYVCWAIARAYSPTLLKPYITELTHAMLLTTCFDREINCRRAASAALQEHVGRQGAQNFGHGIEMITIADYFALGNRSASYCTIAPLIVELDMNIDNTVDIATASVKDMGVVHDSAMESRIINEVANQNIKPVNLTYFTCFVNYLTCNRLMHWDIDIRTLAARSIAQLIKLLEKIPTHGKTCIYFHKEVHGVITQLICTLIEKTTSTTLFVRHGAMLALSEVLEMIFLKMPKLIENQQDRLLESQSGIVTSNPDFELILLPSELLTRIINVIPNIEKARLYRGRGSEMMRESSCMLVHTIAKCHIPISNMKMQCYYITNILNENLKQPHEAVQIAAASALRQFLYTYSKSQPCSLKMESSATNNKKFPMLPTDKVRSLSVDVYMHSMQNILVSNTPGADVGAIRDPDTVAIKRGYALAIGSIPLSLLSSYALSTGGTNDISNQISNELNASALVPSTETINTGSTYSHNLLQIFTLLKLIVSPTMLICGETDADFRNNLLKSVVHLSEMLEVFIEQQHIQAFTTANQIIITKQLIYIIVSICCNGCSDYSIDKRGDTGSWSRMTAVKGFERILKMLNRTSHGRIRGHATSDSFCFSRAQACVVPANEIPKNLVGWHVDTRYGMGIVVSDHRIRVCHPSLQLPETSYQYEGYVEVRYPTNSFGFLYANGMKATGSDGLHTVAVAYSTMHIQLVSKPDVVSLEDEFLDDISMDGNIEGSSVSFNDVVTEVEPQAASIRTDGMRLQLIPEALVSSMISLILKQMSEKLDVVRDVAGSALEAILTSQDPLIHHVPERIILERALKKAKLIVYQNRKMLLTQMHEKYEVALSIDDSVKDSMEKDVNIGASYVSRTTKSVNVGTELPLDTEFDMSTIEICWFPPQTTFPFLMSVLNESDVYFNSILNGLVLAVGGLTESVAVEATNSFLKWCHHMKNISNFYALSKLQSGLILIFQTYQKDDLIMLPLLKTIYCLLENNVFDYITQQKEKDVLDRMELERNSNNTDMELDIPTVNASNFFEYLIKHIRKEANSTNINKIKICIDIFMLCINSNPVIVREVDIKSSAADISMTHNKNKKECTTSCLEMRLCLKSIVACLSHKYPKIRKHAAEQLYLLCISHPNVLFVNELDRRTDDTCSKKDELDYSGFVANHEDLNQLSTLLLNTNFEEMGADALFNLKLLRNTCCTLLHFDTTAVVMKKSVKKTVIKDEADSYENLVREAGY